MRSVVRKLLLGLALQFLLDNAAAQELEPRALSRSPIGAKFIVGGAGVTQGAGDPEGPIANVEGQTSFALIGGGYTFDL